MRKKKQEAPPAMPTPSGPEMQNILRLRKLTMICRYLSGIQRTGTYGMDHGGKMGDAFALFFWDIKNQKMDYIVTAGTPITEQNLWAAEQELRRHWETNMNFGRWTMPWPERWPWEAERRRTVYVR